MSRTIGVIACLLSTALSLACSIDPSDERPGFGLSGEVHPQPVDDWSFTSSVKEISIETATAYVLPHSVTIWCVTLGNQLYVGAWQADTKHWVANVRRDPNVRLKIDNVIYEQKLEPIEDPATIARLNQSYARKYEYDAEDDADADASTAHWRVVARD